MDNELTRQWRFGYVCALTDLRERLGKERLIDCSDPNLTVDIIINKLWEELGEESGDNENS